MGNSISLLCIRFRVKTDKRVSLTALTDITSRGFMSHKAGSRRREARNTPAQLPSEMLGQTRTRSGTDLLGVFSCVGSFWSHPDGVRSDSTRNVLRALAVWGSEPCDWLCAANQRGVWEGRDQHHPVLRTYCISRKRRTYSTRYCVVGGRLHGVFLCNFSAELVRRESDPTEGSTEWLDKGSWPLVG